MEQATCAVCGEPGRLRCADCGGTYCVEHLERHFDLGYYYLCAACSARRAAQQPAPSAKPAPARRRGKQAGT
jgi:hypothetical protein